MNRDINQPKRLTKSFVIRPTLTGLLLIKSDEFNQFFVLKMDENKNKRKINGIPKQFIIENSDEISSNKVAVIGG